MRQAEDSYMKMYEAYKRIFSRCGLTFRAVQADSGAIGGNFSHEFMVLAKTGEDTIVVCTACEYAANMEKAEVKLAAAATSRGPGSNRKRSRPRASARLRRSATFSVFPPPGWSRPWSIWPTANRWRCWSAAIGRSRRSN